MLKSYKGLKLVKNQWPKIKNRIENKKTGVINYMSRRKARKIAVQILYRDEFHPQTLKKSEIQQAPLLLKDLNQKNIPFALSLIKNVQAKKKELDEIIKNHCKGWKLERLSLVDLNIMRVALFEILFCPDIPNNSALNEALELARYFGEKKSVAFINGILDQVLKSFDNKNNPK